MIDIWCFMIDIGSEEYPQGNLQFQGTDRQIGLMNCPGSVSKGVIRGWFTSPILRAGLKQYYNSSNMEILHMVVGQ